MSSYGAAITWVVIMFIIFVTGLLYMMLTPLVDVFLQIGVNNGSDALMITVFQDTWDHWLPITIIFSLIVYGWRKSRNRVDM